MSFNTFKRNCPDRSLGFARRAAFPSYFNKKNVYCENRHTKEDLPRKPSENFEVLAQAKKNIWNFLEYGQAIEAFLSCLAANALNNDTRLGTAFFSPIMAFNSV